jgi:hypothetical protein
MNEINAITQEARNQFNTPTIVFMCPNCKEALCFLAATDYKAILMLSVPIEEWHQEKNVLFLQINSERFVWSQKESRYVSPTGYDGKRHATRQDRKILEISLKEQKRFLSSEKFLPSRKSEVEAGIKRIEELLKNLGGRIETGPEMIYQEQLLVNPERKFECCDTIICTNLLPHMKHVLDETEANPSPHVLPPGT